MLSISKGALRLTCTLLAYAVVFFHIKVPPLNKLWGVLKVGGILLAVGGAVTMAIAKGKDGNNDQNDTLGAILSLVNTILFGFYLAMQVFCAHESFSI